MSKDVLCIYHGNCADGFGAAWAVRYALGDSVEFHAGVYQQDPPDVTNKTVIMVDFSYKKPVIEKMAASAKAILILDHHKSAAEDLAEFPEPPDDIEGHSGWLPSQGIYARFDMGKSGAVLAWEHFNNLKPIPRLLEHIQDRDLWKFQLDGTREIQAALFSYPYDFELWDKIFSEGVERLQRDGSAIERKHFKDIEELVKVCERPMEIGGFIVPVASLPYTLVSDAAHQMADAAPFAACYWDTLDSRVFGLRSTDKGEDVSAIAKQYGGGGHRNSAGFSVPRSHILAMS